jgi:hypothetical protein
MAPTRSRLKLALLLAIYFDSPPRMASRCIRKWVSVAYVNADPIRTAEDVELLISARSGSGISWSMFRST